MIILNDSNITVESFPEIYCDLVSIPIEFAPRTFIQWLRGDEAEVTRVSIFPGRMEYTDLVFTSDKDYATEWASITLANRVYIGLIVGCDSQKHNNLKYRHRVKIEYIEYLKEK